MKLDHTFIAIRHRDILEICDLALRVIREHALTLLSILVMIAAPLGVLDWWIVYGGSNNIATSGDDLYPYWLMAVLVISQTQLATTPIARYLGRAMFEGRVSVRESLSIPRKTLAYFGWLYGVLRLGLPIVFFVWLARSSDEDGLLLISLLLLPGMLVVMLITNGVRPFVAEILVLEKTPIRKSTSGTICFAERSSALHVPATGFLFGRHLLICGFAVLLHLLIYASFSWVNLILNVIDTVDSWFLPIIWSIALWLTTVFVAVVRFLSYIDLRIRQEGWAVELKLRAEGLRWQAAIGE